MVLLIYYYQLKSEEISAAKELGNAIAPQGGVGDLDDEIPF
mgnify:CR=1 FL=1